MLTTGARAALERRDPDLADLVPSEIVQAIRSRSASSSASTDVQVTVETIEALLKEPSGDYGAGRTAKPNDGLSYQQREEARRTIQHRVRPLLPYAQAAADVIRRDREPHEVLEQALARLETDVTGASEYPYRDSRYYIAKIGFAVLFTVANSVGSLSAETARGLVEWLVKSPVVRQSSLWIDVVSHLAQRDATQETALSLAQNTHELICENTDVSERVSAYGQLARAVWCASLSDAQAYFRRGLDIADAIGSDDQDKARQLVQFGACYSGPMLAPQIVHDFVRMCELNLAYEPEKTFDWVDVGRALSRLAGIASLALVARLSDRETVDLRWSLPPLLTALVEDGHLAPNLAAGLIGVAEPAETWSWRLGDFVSAVFPRLAPATREIVANNLLQELDRQHLATPPQSTLDRLIAELRPQLEEPSPALARLAQLKFEADLEHAVEKKGTWALPDAEHFTVDGPQASGATSAAELDKALAGIDLSDATDIDALLVTEQSGQAGRSNPAFLLNRLARRAKHPDDRRRFLRAICKTTIPSLGDKLSGVRDVISQWRAQSPAAKDELPGLGIDLATRHALDLIGTSWEVSYELRELQELSQARGVDLVAAIIRALRDEVLNVRSATWLAFANLSVGAASPAAIGAALERFVSSSAGDLPEDLGDGPWRTDFAISGEEPEEVVAGLLWLRLGAPEARERWRASHTIRRLVELGCADVLSRLMRKFESRSAGPFQDRSLPFFFLHARLWFLIGLARIAQDQPSTLLPFRQEVAAIAFNPEFPHAVMRHFAGAALRWLAASLDDTTEREALLKRLSLVNVSPFPRAKERQPDRSANPWARPEDVPEPDPPFRFDYDFTRYQVEDLARVFGYAAWQVKDACVAWIRGWSGSVRSMHDCPRAARGFDRNRYDRWSLHPERDRCGGHLAWHALMLTAGQFLAQRPVSGNSWEEDPWQSWIAGELLSRADGLWLADGTDPFPPELRHPVVEGNRPGEVGEREMPAVPSDPGGLSALVGLKGEALGAQLIVDGSWPSTDGIDVTVRSVLADPQAGYYVALAVAVAKPFFQWLPREDDHFDWQKLGDARSPIRAWTTTSPHSDRQLDRHDPYTASTALNRPRPTDKITGALDLVVGDPFTRVWRDPAGKPAFYAEAWGATGGTGEYAWDKSGFRLICRAKTLLTFLEAQDVCLVLLVKAQKYLKHAGTTDGKFAVSTLLMTIMPSGGIELVLQIPDNARTAIETLGRDEQHDFVRRFEAIRLAAIERSI